MVKINYAIATGGTLARKIVLETKPKCIIAIACHRDLTDGILDVFPLPIYGILNTLEYGPCISTKVDLNKLDCIIKEIINHHT